MFAALLVLLLQSTSVKGTLEVPPGGTPPPTARVVLLPLQYARQFNADAQIRIDNYWESFKGAGLARRNKELFIQYMPIIYESVLETVVAEMRRDSKVNFASLVKTAPQGHFEFTNVPPGEYKLVATAAIRGEDFVWTETIQVESTGLVVQMKTRVP